MFDINKFTHKSQEAIQKSIGLAQELHNQAIEPEHLALALAQGDGVVPGFLQSLGMNAQELLGPLRRYLDSRPSVETSTQQGPHVSPRLDTVLTQAQGLASSMKDEYVAQEHLLL